MERNKDGLNYIATKDVGYGFEPIKYSTGLRIGSQDNNFKIAPKNALLICLEGGSAGKKMGLVEQEIAFGNKLFAVVCNSWIDPNYLLMYFLSSKFQSDFQAQMSGIIGGISKAKFSNLQISIPPLEEQKRIVNKVKELVNLCDSLETQFTLSKSLSTAARRSAVDAISTAQTPEETQKAWERIEGNWEFLTGNSDSVESIRFLVHDLATQGVFSDEEIFEVVELKDIAQINYGYTESAKRTEVGPKFLRITDIQVGKVDWETVPYCPISSADEEKYLLKDGDLVFARTGATTGKSFLLHNPPRSVCASYLIRVRPDTKKILPTLFARFSARCPINLPVFLG
jgi:type I restriction enzyme, S subunit